MEKTASQVLREAKALIGTPEKWLPGNSAQDPDSGRLCIGCSMKFKGTAVDYFDRALEDYVPSRPIPQWNRPIYKFNADPKTTHADVMAAFDRAIALAEADEKKNAPWTQADTMRVIEGIGSAGQRQSKSDHLAVVTS